MEKIKQGKMDKKAFWLTVAIVYLLIIMLAVNLQTGDVLGESGRIAVGIIAFLIYIAACAMRLRDAGKSMVHMLILCILPVYMFVIACYESEELHNMEETETINENMESVNREYKW